MVHVAICRPGAIGHAIDGHLAGANRLTELVNVLYQVNGPTKLQHVVLLQTTRKRLFGKSSETWEGRMQRKVHKGKAAECISTRRMITISLLSIKDLRACLQNGKLVVSSGHYEVLPRTVEHACRVVLIAVLGRRFLDTPDAVSALLVVVFSGG